MSETVKGIGAPKERLQHSKIVGRVAEITRGGSILTVGQRDTQHCYLDWLLDNGYLGQDAGSRYDTGYRLRDLYYFIRPSGGASGSGTPGRTPMTVEGSIYSGKDMAETVYNWIMREMEGHGRLVRMICIEDVSPCSGSEKFHSDIRTALDKLYDSIRVCEKRWDKLIEEHGHRVE